MREINDHHCNCGNHHHKPTPHPPCDCSCGDDCAGIECSFPVIDRCVDITCENLVQLHLGRDKKLSGFIQAVDKHLFEMSKELRDLKRTNEAYRRALKQFIQEED